jgi:hypothetical protein
VHELSDFFGWHDSASFYVAQAFVDGSERLGIFLATQRGPCQLRSFGMRHFVILMLNFARRN